MADQVMTSLLGSALKDLRADAVAIGAAVGDHMEFAVRGTLADEPVHSKTVFYGASVTKQIVGLVAAQAVVQGALTVDDSIVEWVPELPVSMVEVRLSHLIHHTSGLPDVADPATGVPRSNSEIIERFCEVEAPVRQPGTEYAYNNAGYVLLAEALARSLQRPIRDLASQLFASLGLSDAVLGGTAVQLPERTDPPRTIGDGGLWTSVRDLTRWLQACNLVALGAETHRLAESTSTLLDGSLLDYAWGVRVTPTPMGRLITHGGSWDPWLAKTARIPERGVAIAVLSVGAAELDVSRTGTDLATVLASHQSLLDRYR